MKYIIMADGKGQRWHNHGNTPKHLIKIGGETLLERTFRLIHLMDPEGQVIITSHDERCDVAGATRHEPLNNVLEIDRFTHELIEDDICFLYGDTFYSEASVKTIVESKTKDILFFGNRKSIVGIKIKSGDMFLQHVERVRQLYLDGKISKCIGWQVYRSIEGLPLEEMNIGGRFIVLHDETRDFNSPEDLIYNKE